MESYSAVCRLTFDAEGCYTLVNCVESILYCIPALSACLWWEGGLSMGITSVKDTRKEGHTDLYELPTTIESAGLDTLSGIG
jgi:hypothetical protein